MAEQVPAELIAGDTWAWTRDLSYSAALYTGVWYFENQKDAFSITASASGATFVGAMAAATSGAKVAGRYRWRFVVTKISDSTRTTVEQGWVEVLPDPAAAGKLDWRSHARRTLEALEAVIEGRASSDQESISIAGRSLSRMPIAELLKFRDSYAAMASSEEAAEQVAAGLGNPRRIFVRFGRA